MHRETSEVDKDVMLIYTDLRWVNYYGNKFEIMYHIDSLQMYSYIRD